MMWTSINGKSAEWTDEIRAEWDALAAERPAGEVTHANYFTPRAATDAYNRGDLKTGFIYTLIPARFTAPQVFGVAWYTDEEGKRIYVPALQSMPVRR